MRRASHQAGGSASSALIASVQPNTRHWISKRRAICSTNARRSVAAGLSVRAWCWSFAQAYRPVAWTYRHLNRSASACRSGKRAGRYWRRTDQLENIQRAYDIVNAAPQIMHCRLGLFHLWLHIMRMWPQSVEAHLPGRYATAFIRSADNLPGRFPRVLATLISYRACAVAPRGRPPH